MKRLLYISSLLMFFPVLLLAQDNIGGKNLSLDTIYNFVKNLGDYLYTAAGILIGVGFVVSGILYMSAGSNSGRVKQAKDMFKVALIAGLIIFGIAIILSTLRVIGSGTYGLFGPPQTGSPGTGATCQGGARDNQPCTTGNECPIDLPCGAPDPECQYTHCL